MFKFSDLTIETAVANRSEAMEARDHFKNGASPKSHKSRGNFLIVITALVAIIFSMVACGGGSGSGSKGSKIPNGTYVENNQGSTSLTFSGNKVIGKEGGNVMSEGTYELVEEYKEKDFSRGTLIVNFREGKWETKYVLEGNKLTVDGMVLTKK